MTKRKPKEDGKAKRLSSGRVESGLCKILAGKPDAFLKKAGGKFPHEFKVVRPPIGAPIILEIVENAAKIVSDDFVAGYLRDYVEYLDHEFESFNVPFKTCKAAVQCWANKTVDLTELPKPVAFKSDPDLCMTRLDFDPLEPQDLSVVAPMFASILSRVKTNREALCQRIGSIYEPNADRKQAVWISGPGDAGKSQIEWLLQVLSGGSFGILQDFDKSYWKAPIVGKRVGLVHEAPARFIRSDEFKSLTGDETHAINDKYSKVIVVKLSALIFFSSNQEPEIPHDDALISRIIDCRMESVPAAERVEEPFLRAKLMDELPYIAGHCLALYRKLSGYGRIPCETTALEDTIGRFESDYLDLLEHHFIADENEFVTRSRVREVVEERFGKDRAHQHHVKRILKNRLFCVEKKHSFQTSKSSVEKRLYVYFGIRERTQEEQQFGKKDETKPKVLEFKR